MDIADIARYDDAVTVDIKHPLTGEDVGISFSLVSFESERVSKAMRAIEVARMRDALQSGDIEVSSEDAAEYIERAEREKLIAAIVGWDFNGNSFGDLGVNPDCTEENKRKVINHPGSKWIRDQLIAKGDSVRDFIKPPEKRSAKGSRTK